MNYKVFNIALPIKENNVQIIDGLVQGNTANIVNVRLMDGVEPFDFTGYTEVFLDIVKPDGTYIDACITDNPEYNSNNPYTIQVLDPKTGLISFALQGQATVLEGSHFGEITIVGGGALLTAARINYYVGDTIQRETDPESLTSSDDYVSLRNMIMKNSAISTAEANRNLAEGLRMSAEEQRELRMVELEDYIRSYLENATGYVAESKGYMEQAELYAQLAQNPSAEIIEQLLEGFNFASIKYVDDQVENATADFDAGTYTNPVKPLQFVRGADSELPALEQGEPAWSTDANIFYVGGAEGAVPINGTFEAGVEAPERHDILWIDLSAGAAVKYWDGEAWQPTATATFA